MAKRRKGKQRVDTAGVQPPLTSSPFAALGELHGRPPAQDKEQARQPATDQQAAPPSPSAPGRAVVRFQRKGRGGKEVTLVEKLDLTPELLDQWLAKLKRGLGCGGVREGGTLVIQGDQRERIPDLLRRRGVSKISVS